MRPLSVCALDSLHCLFVSRHAPLLDMLAPVQHTFRSCCSASSNLTGLLCSAFVRLISLAGTCGMTDPSRCPWPMRAPTPTAARCSSGLGAALHCFPQLVLTVSGRCYSSAPVPTPWLAAHPTRRTCSLSHCQSGGNESTPTSTSPCRSSSSPQCPRLGWTASTRCLVVWSRAWTWYLRSKR